MIKVQEFVDGKIINEIVISENKVVEGELSFALLSSSKEFSLEQSLKRRVNGQGNIQSLFASETGLKIVDK